MYQKTMGKQCNNVKWVTHSDEPTENYQLNLQLPSALQSYIEFQLIVFIHL